MSEPVATEQRDPSTMTVGELPVEVDSEREVLDAELLAEKQALEQQSLDVDAKLAEINVTMKKLSRVGRIIRNLIIGSLVVPFCAAMAISMYRNIESATMQVQAMENVTHGGEFDPTMGEKITTKNGRALVVVHEGFGLQVLPQKYANNPDYLAYLRNIEAEKQLYYENGDPVVIVVTGLSILKGEVVLEPRPNTLYYVTQENNGFGANSFISDGVLYRQPMSSNFFDPQGQGPWSIYKKYWCNGSGDGG